MLLDIANISRAHTSCNVYGSQKLWSGIYGISKKIQVTEVHLRVKTLHC